MLCAIYMLCTLILILVLISLQIINLYATMFNSLWEEESVKYALSTFDSKFLTAVGKEWLTHGQFIRKQKKRANELCRSLIRHDMVSLNH